MDLLPTYKPSGINTHRTSEQRSEWGFVEWLEEKLQKRLYLFQRLDAGTSGLLLMAETEEAAALWSQRMKLKKISKKYLFITKINKKNLYSLHQSFRFSSFISKKGNTWTSAPSVESQKIMEKYHIRGDDEELVNIDSNSETIFSLLQTHGSHQLWSAEPITGKTHQIRLHAQSLGIPILGDTLYGGEPFYRLCLHALEIEYKEGVQSWRVEPPPFFFKLDLLSNPNLCALLGAADLRHQLIERHYMKSDSYRLIHNECPSLRVDCFGEQLWIYDYDPAKSESLIQDFFRFYPQTPTWIREMKNRGQQPQPSLLRPLFNPSARWIIKENNLHYELRSDQGLSPGLFLDQKENRSWVQLNSKNKKILNVFSYTCGFSLNAAKGEAREVVSVDVSSAFLDWGKQNFQLNHLDPKSFEFWAADSIEFVKRTLKIKRKFDLIICDPPSFGRSKKGVFNIEKDFSSMVGLLFELLEPSGKILLSTNFEKWTYSQFLQKSTQDLNPHSYSEFNHPKPSLDFIEGRNPILKTLILERL